MPMASVIRAPAPRSLPSSARPGPFAFSQPTALAALATATGLETPAPFVVDAPFRYPGLGSAVRGMDSSGVATRARAASGQPAATAAHRRALAPFARPDGPVEVGAEFLVLRARKPACRVAG